MPSNTSLPRYLCPGSTLTFRHLQYGDMRATVLPFSADVQSTCPVVLIKLKQAPLGCPMRVDTSYIVKIFDPRFYHPESMPWDSATEAAAARTHNGHFQFNPKRPPSMLQVDYEEDKVEFEAQLFHYLAWLHHNECLAYKYLAPLQGSVVPRLYGAGTLDLSATTPPRAISPFVIFVEYIPNAISASAIDARRMTAPLLRAIVDTGEVLRSSGVIHCDANLANFLLVPAHDPTRVVVLDFAEAYTREAVQDDDAWQLALCEYDPVWARKVQLRNKLEKAGLKMPDDIEPRQPAIPS
ncbi:hypothetical protein PsYK624_054780 [Phanerochaete sordida]|uniref:Protein kinase domain-containing protein n=1 Tax=Phanerochaete sordida TaxID=48140 RepID=A0A9P3G6V6_9APHY|nr:hypothetical protein PsYK624_054780 [Phanerochaete sordida]